MQGTKSGISILALGLVMSGAVACFALPIPGGTIEPDEGGAVPEDSGPADDGGADAGSTAPACGASAPQGGACNTIADVGPMVVPTCADGAPPVGAGGTITPGVYVLTAQTYYEPGADGGACGKTPLSATLVGTADCVELSVTLDEAVTTVPFTEAATVAVQGNRLTSTITCASSSLECDSRGATFTATPTGLTIAWDDQGCGGALVEVYTKQ